mgnify:CR=1 FL=1
MPFGQDTYFAVDAEKPSVQLAPKQIYSLGVEFLGLLVTAE